MAHRFERGVSWILVLLSLGFILWAACLIALDLFSTQIKGRGLLDKLPEPLRQRWPFSALAQALEPVPGPGGLPGAERGNPVMLTDDERARAATLVVNNPLSEATTTGRAGSAASRPPKETFEEYMPSELGGVGNEVRRRATFNPLSRTTAAGTDTGAMRLFRAPPGAGVYGQAAHSGGGTI